jgi:hypothetical protein
VSLGESGPCYQFDTRPWLQASRLTPRDRGDLLGCVLPQPFDDMAVYAERDADVGMAQLLLHYPRVDARLQRHGRPAMAKIMHTNRRRSLITKITDAPCQRLTERPGEPLGVAMAALQSPEDQRIISG